MVFSFWSGRFCCAKSVACGRVIEREWGNPSKVPPSHSPFLAVGGSADNKTCGRSQKETPSDRMVFSFWNVPRAGLNSLPRPARSASNPEVKAGPPRMALPFVGCREASSSLAYFAAQSAKTKETPSFGRFFFLECAAGRVELAASTGAHQRTDCCRISCRAACPQAAAVYRRCLRLPRGGVRAPRPTHERGEPFRRGRRPRRPVSAAVPRWERIPTLLRAAKQVPLGYSSE